MRTERTIMVNLTCFQIFSFFDTHLRLWAQIQNIEIVQVVCLSISRLAGHLLVIVQSLGPLPYELFTTLVTS